MNQLTDKITECADNAWKVSIIMPGFNCEAYISETLKCLSAQTYRNFELYFLDDCSKDHTCEIIKAYDAPFVLHLIENSTHKGAALLRNEGLYMVQGEYVIFLDSDDLFEPEYLEEMVYTLQTTGADIALAEYDSFRSAEGYHKCKKPAFIPSFLTYASHNNFLWKEIPVEFKHWTNVPWNKMYRRQFLLKIQASFQNLPCSNDVYFSHYSMIQGKIRHVRTPDAMIHYRNARKDSISADHDFFSEVSAYQKLIAEIDHADSITVEKIYEDLIFGIMNRLRRSKVEMQPDLYNQLRQDIYKSHRIFPESYVKEHQPWLLELFSSPACSSIICNVNYRLIYMLEKYQDRLQSFADYKLSGKKVGVLSNGEDIRLLAASLHLENVHFLKISELDRVRPDVILCTSIQQLTDLENYKKINDLIEVPVLSLFEILYY